MSINHLTVAGPPPDLDVRVKSLTIGGEPVVAAGKSFAFYQNLQSATPVGTNSGTFPVGDAMTLPTVGEFYVDNDATRFSQTVGTGITVLKVGVYSIDVQVDFECNPGVNTRHYLGNETTLYSSTASIVGERVTLSYSQITELGVGDVVDIRLADSIGGNTELIHGFTINLKYISG